MIHQARDKAKFRRLSRMVAAAYGCSRPMADTLTIGHLERLWHLTMLSAPRGDVGQCENVEIADECGWEMCPDQFVDMLTETGWLDPDDAHRLVVHDWSEHAPAHIKRNIGKKGGFIETPKPRLNASTDAVSGDLTHPEMRQARTPNQTKPNQTIPPTPQPSNDTPPGAPAADPWRGVGEELAKVGVGKWRSLVADCQQARLTPEIVLALIVHYRQHAPSWGPGALVHRIALQTPDGPAPDAGWPDPAAEAVAKRNREDAAKRRQAWDARMDREREQADRDRQRLADLEAEHGPTVDAMPRDQLRELLSELPPLAAKVANEGPLSPLVRSMAIELIASRQPQPP